MGRGAFLEHAAEPLPLLVRKLARRPQRLLAAEPVKPRLAEDLGPPGHGAPVHAVLAGDPNPFSPISVRCEQFPAGGQSPPFHLLTTQLGHVPSRHSHPNKGIGLALMNAAKLT
jgi:hypothetical protein